MPGILQVLQYFVVVYYLEMWMCLMAWWLLQTVYLVIHNQVPAKDLVFYWKESIIRLPPIPSMVMIWVSSARSIRATIRVMLTRAMLPISILAGVTHR